MSEQPEKPFPKPSKSKTNPFLTFAIDPSLLIPPNDPSALSITSKGIPISRQPKRKQPDDGIDPNHAEGQVKMTSDDEGIPPAMEKRRGKKKLPKERAESEMPSLPHPLGDTLFNRTNSRERAVSSPPVIHGGPH